MDDSVGTLIPGLRQKTPQVVEAFFRRAYPPMVRLARRLLRGVPQGESDEEDVVNAAFHSFLRRTADDQFQLSDSHDLWKVIQTIVARKAANHRRRQQRRIDHVPFVDEQETACQRHCASLENQEYEWWLSHLDSALRPIARLKLNRRTNVEIAAELGRSVATVERRLSMIRSQWFAVDDDDLQAWIRSGEDTDGPS